MPAILPSRIASRIVPAGVAVIASITDRRTIWPGRSDRWTWSAMRYPSLPGVRAWFAM